MRREIILTVLMALLSSSCVYCQNRGNTAVIPIFFQDEDPEDEVEDTGRGFSIGLSIGAYFANKKSAVFYDGSGFHDLEDNQTNKLSIPQRLTPVTNGGRLPTNQYNQILTYYNAQGYEFPSDYYPLNMRYQPSFLYGLQMKYSFNYTNAIVMNVNVANLKTVDVYTIRFIGTTQQPNAQTDVRTLDINGTEDRFQITLGYRTGVEMGPQSNWYFGLGGSMLGSKIKTNQIFIADRSYDLLIGLDNPQQPIYYQPRTEIGFGGYLSTGVEMYFSDNYELDFGVLASRDKVVLGTYSQNLFNYSIFLTFSI